MMKWQDVRLLTILGLLILSACHTSMGVQLLDKPCNGIANGNDITDVDGETELCLIVDTERPFLNWSWSDDGSTLAFALHDPTITRPPGSGKFPNQLLTTDWYVMTRNENNATIFNSAHNKGLTLSPDGKYAVVSVRCSADLTACNDVYQTNNKKKICSYKTWTLWFSESDCPTLTMKNGEVWDIEYEEDKAGCEYYQAQGWDIPVCDGAEPVTLTPTSKQASPTSTPVTIHGESIATPLIGNNAYPVEAYP